MPISIRQKETYTIIDFDGRLEEFEERMIGQQVLLAKLRGWRIWAVYVRDGEISMAGEAI